MIFHYDHIMIIIVFVMFLSALIRATFGFGNALVAMPLLALVLDLKSAAPLVALFATVLAFNQLGDGLRRALDPVMRR